MQNNRSFLPAFLLFLFLSVIIFFLSRGGIFAGLGFFTSPFFALQGKVFQVAELPGTWFRNTTIENLQKENRMLSARLVHVQQLEEDNAALRDQFQTTGIPSSTLLPAEVIGKGEFIAGISTPETLVIDKGSADGIAIGDTVVSETNVVGTISQTAVHAALVQLVSNPATSFTAKTSATHAQGVLTGQGNGVMILGNVVLSDSLKVGDMVVTSGSEDIHGKGFPEGILVGKILSVNKNPSSLYQSASVESLLDLQTLETVFVIK